MNLKKNAEQSYDKYLSEITAKHGKKTTNSGQLTTIGKSLFGGRFRGVFASDQIPNMRSNQFAIVNLDDSNLPGSHWVGIVKNKKKTLVYDSFGRKTLSILPELVQSGNGIIVESENDAEQSESQDNCGQRCLAWLCVYKKLGWEGAKWV